MLSYHNDPAVKQKYVTRFAAHRELDQVIQGTGFDHESGRGCFVGCTLDSYNHSRFPVELGWPEWLAHLADAIFEGIPKDEAPQFGTDLLDAVPIGVDLEPVRHLLAIRRLSRLIELQTSNKKAHPELSSVFDQTIAAVATVIRCHEAEAGLSSCSLIDWSAAESAAWSAAESAARSAESAARSAAESAWQKERNDLLDILRNLNSTNSGATNQ